MKDTKPTLADLRKLRAAAQEIAEQARKTTARQKHPARESLPDTDASARAADSDRTRTPEPLDPADQALFRQAMRFVQPLPDHGPRARILAGAGRDPELLLRTRRLHAQGATPDLDAGRPPSLPHRSRVDFDPQAQEFLQPGCGTDLVRGLRRGRWIPQATLDLHGSTLDQARERLDRFLASCLEHGIRCVRVIHGKGIGSHRGEPILKDAIRLHLSRQACVQAWVQCDDASGGAGAVHALLRLPQQD